jgi:hypothetical protein
MKLLFSETGSETGLSGELIICTYLLNDKSAFFHLTLSEFAQVQYQIIFVPVAHK